MFDNIICPDVAYEQLKKSGVANKILSEPAKANIYDSLLYRRLEDFDYIKETLMSNRLSPEKISMYKEFVDCQEKFDSIDFMMTTDFEPFLEKHPVYLGYLALGEDVLEYEKFGFENRKSLEKAVTSFCIGERHEFFSNDDWVWRNGGFKNIISRNIHGDLHVSQQDSSGESRLDKTLFGDVKVFDCVKENNTHGFGAYQDWSEFLVSLLKYSEKVGMSGIEEIVDWKGTLEKIGGGRSGNYTESFGGLSGTKDAAYTLMDRQLVCEGEEQKKFPLLVSNQNSWTTPFFKNDKLMYLRKDKGGDITLNGRTFEKDRFSKVVEYNPEDLPEAVRATLKYFARSREMIPAIMDEFSRKK